MTLRLPGFPKADARFRSVVLWLQLPISAASLMYLTAGRLNSPQYRPDTQSYLDIAERGVFSVEGLSSSRTLGYPAFLQSVQWLSGTLAPVPLLHWLIFCGAVVLFAYALFRIGGSPRLCIFLTSPLFFSDVVAGYLPVLLTEVPATALAIASTAMLVLAVRDPYRWRWWFGLAITVFLCYQTRPAFLFLIPLVPVLVLLIRPLAEGDLHGRYSRWHTLVCGTSVVMLPFLGFSLLRLATVGHFGLISFAGTNVLGIAGAFLDDAMLPRLSAEVRPLAEGMLAIRSGSEMDDLQHERSARWEHAIQVRAGIGVPNYDVIDRLYNPTIFQVAYPAAKGLYGDDQITMNRAFSRLSREVILLRPVSYGLWVAMACFQSLVTAMTLYLMLGVVILSVGLFLLQRVIDCFRASHSTPCRNPFMISSDDRRVAMVAVTIALVFFGAKTMLVALVEPTIPRYVRPAAVFLPMLPALLVYLQSLQRSSAPKQQAQNLQDLDAVPPNGCSITGGKQAA